MTDSKENTDAEVTEIDIIVEAARENLIRTFNNDGVVVVVGVLVGDILSVKAARNTDLTGEGPDSKVLGKKVEAVIEAYLEGFPKLSPAVVVRTETKT